MKSSESSESSEEKSGKYERFGYAYTDLNANDRSEGHKYYKAKASNSDNMMSLPMMSRAWSKFGGYKGHKGKMNWAKNNSGWVQSGNGWNNGNGQWKDIATLKQVLGSSQNLGAFNG